MKYFLDLDRSGDLAKILNDENIEGSDFYDSIKSLLQNVSQENKNFMNNKEIDSNAAILNDYFKQILDIFLDKLQRKSIYDVFVTLQKLFLLELEANLHNRNAFKEENLLCMMYRFESYLHFLFDTNQEEKLKKFDKRFFVHSNKRTKLKYQEKTRLDAEDMLNKILVDGSKGLGTLDNEELMKGIPAGEQRDMYLDAFFELGNKVGQLHRILDDIPNIGFEKLIGKLIPDVDGLPRRFKSRIFDIALFARNRIQKLNLLAHTYQGDKKKFITEYLGVKSSNLTKPDDIKVSFGPTNLIVEFEHKRDYDIVRSSLEDSGCLETFSNDGGRYMFFNESHVLGSISPGLILVNKSKDELWKKKVLNHEKRHIRNISNFKSQFDCATLLGFIRHKSQDEIIAQFESSDKNQIIKDMTHDSKEMYNYLKYGISFSRERIDTVPYSTSGFFYEQVYDIYKKQLVEDIEIVDDCLKMMKYLGAYDQRHTLYDMFNLSYYDSQISRKDIRTMMINEYFGIAIEDESKYKEKFPKGSIITLGVMRKDNPNMKIDDLLELM